MINRFRRCKEVRPPGDRGCRQHPEISPIKRVRRLPVHEEDFARGNDAAALPGGQRPASAVAMVRFTVRDVVDGNGQSVSANGLSRQRQDALQHGHAAGQMTARERRCLP